MLANKRLNAQWAMTLLELMAVMAILGIMVMPFAARLARSTDDSHLHEQVFAQLSSVVSLTRATAYGIGGELIKTPSGCEYRGKDGYKLAFPIKTTAVWKIYRDKKEVQKVSISTDGITIDFKFIVTMGRDTQVRNINGLTGSMWVSEEVLP